MGLAGLLLLVAGIALILTTAEMEVGLVLLAVGIVLALAGGEGL